jgi:peroxiredoxin Q/BCP
MQVGEFVPDFTATTDTGVDVSLAELLEKGPVVLFFYPKAETPGCTAEACHFRDLAGEFAEVGAQRVGISRDDVDTQRAFGAKHGFDFPLLSDPDGAIAKIFGAKRVGPLWSKRQTFVIDTDRTVRAVIKSESDMEQHADEALSVLDVLAERS